MIRNDPVDDLVADLNDLAKQRGWQTHTWGNYPGYIEVLIDRRMTLDDLAALAAALDATLTLKVRPKEMSGGDTCKHGNDPLNCDACDDIGRAHAAGWHAGYEYAFLADCALLPRWLRWLVARYVPGLTATPKETP